MTNERYCVFLNAGDNNAHYNTEMAGEIQRVGDAGSYMYHPVAGFERRPVRAVSWDAATVYCNWLSEVEGRPSGAYHLPTEAQWEKAAAWDPVQQKLWRYSYQSDGLDCSKANVLDCVGHITDVGSYPGKSYYGCYDMTGNVWEWCADYCGGD